MKLGNGKIKFKFKFVYKLTGRVAIKYVYADTLEEAKALFSKEYSDCLDVKILDIFIMQDAKVIERIEKKVEEE